MDYHHARRRTSSPLQIKAVPREGQPQEGAMDRGGLEVGQLPPISRPLLLKSHPQVCGYITDEQLILPSSSCMHE
jgi:hypothetical protein